MKILIGRLLDTHIKQFCSAMGLCAYCVCVCACVGVDVHCACMFIVKVSWPVKAVYVALMLLYR